MMMDRIFPATNDVIFKKIFGDIKNKSVIKGFLSCILDLPEDEYDVLEIGNPVLNIDNGVDGKTGILDVKLRTKTEKVIDIEVQVAKVNYMRERILYYLSKLTVDQIGSGEGYDKIQKVVCIVIAADHILVKENDKLHNRYRLYDPETGSTFTDKMEINTLDLMKRADPKTVDPEVHEWVKFFNARTKDTLEMAQSSKIEAVKKAANIVLKVNADDKTRIEAEQRENAVRSYQTDMEASEEKGRKEGIKEGRKEGIKEGLKEGRKEGIKEGCKEGKIEVVKSSLKIGLDYETISAITGLSVEEIEKLR